MEVQYFPGFQDFEFCRLSELYYFKRWFSFENVSHTLMALCRDKPEVTGLKITPFNCINKSNRLLQLPATPVGWEKLQPLAASCHDGWLVKMTVISPACHLLTEPWEACCIRVLLLLKKDSVFIPNIAEQNHVYRMSELTKQTKIKMTRKNLPRCAQLMTLAWSCMQLEAIYSKLQMSPDRKTWNLRA